MSCHEFLAGLNGAVESEAALGHLRSCESCMNVAAAQDPMNLFRAVGGEELEPEGGVDLFVSEVMDQVRLTDRRLAIAPPTRSVASRWRWTAAAAVIVGMLSFATMYRPAGPVEVLSPEVSVAQEFVSRPVVESYEGAGAMIVEVPQQHSEIQLVMIFDDSLPVDL